MSHLVCADIDKLNCSLKSTGVDAIEKNLQVLSSISFSNIVNVFVINFDRFNILIVLGKTSITTLTLMVTGQVVVNIENTQENKDYLSFSTAD